jgi:iron(III) transport system permease protein
MALLAWLPALIVLLVPAWLVVRAFESPGAIEALVDGGGAASLPELVLRSLGLAGAVALTSLLLALPLAFLTTRTDLPARRTLGVLLALPLALPSYVGAFALVSAFGRGGLVAELIGAESMPDFYGFGGAVLALSLLGYPYVLLPLQAALRHGDGRLEESARVLGDGPWRAFMRVTLPLLVPAMSAGMLMVALYALSDFGAVSMLQYNSFTRAIYMQHDAFNRSGAALLALVLVALTIAILWLEVRLRRRGGRLVGRSAPGAVAPRPLRLGPWRWVALAFVLLVLSLALVAPVGVVVMWAIEGGNRCEFCTGLGTLTLHTFEVSLLTALVAMIAVVPVARYATRRGGLAGALPDRILYGGFAIPGVVIALALVFVGTRWLPGLYQTLPLLVLACVVRFLPQAADTLRPAMAQVPPSLEEAARTLGVGPIRAFWTITMPLVRTAWLTGGALVFLTTLKELPATLVMRPAGWDTLATELWDLTNEGYYGEAAMRALMLLALAVVPMVIILFRRQRRA